MSGARTADKPVEKGAIFLWFKVRKPARVVRSVVQSIFAGRTGQAWKAFGFWYSGHRFAAGDAGGASGDLFGPDQ
jgi:hypothetical protein